MVLRSPQRVGPFRAGKRSAASAGRAALRRRRGWPA